ncbi:hypothetical protein ACFX2B_017682 [Malus domestica]
MHKVMYQFHLKLTYSFGLGQVRYKPYSRSPPSHRARRFTERGNRQGLFLNWVGGFSGFLQSIRPTQEFEGQNKSIKSRMWYLLWKHKMLKMSTREQCQVRTRPKEKTGKKHDIRYSCF